MSLTVYLQSQPGAFVLCASLLGLLIGSFLNVVIHRLPLMLQNEWRDQCTQLLAGEEDTTPAEEAELSLMHPRSRCPKCGHGITALENVPILSYLCLRGRCSACNSSIPLRYPLVEILGGLVAAGAAWHFGFAPAAAAAMILGWALIAASFIDFDHQLLPDSITLPLLWLGLALNLFEIFTTLESAVIGAIAGYGSLWLVFHAFRLLTGKEGMGYGDFKLLAVFGAWLGWHALPAVILLSSLAGAIIGMALIAVAGRERSLPIPFGPYLALAGWITLYWGDDLNHAYLQWSGLA